LTTFLSYGGVACQRQGEIIRDLAKPQRTALLDFNDLVKAVAREMHSSL